ncbi:hypothetical protein MACJ_004098 [Theileria orientalis]|uniref:Uncharacterized protein n=1 Tax=Theileria orientalis TaxID=68886 RepID=A0A976XK19_THEOR|nr:hypothetical protein MACJ_004098 [Theileria orientalis]
MSISNNAIKKWKSQNYTHESAVISAKKDEHSVGGDAPIGGSEKNKKKLISLEYDEKIQVYPLKQNNPEEGPQKAPKLPPGEFK